MELPDITIEDLKGYKLPWQPIQIFPLGDTHIGQQGTSDNEIKRFVAEGLDRGAWFLGMGDYIDLATPSNRNFIRSANLYDVAREAFTEKAERLIEHYLLLTKGTEGKWIGLLHGHHYFEFEDGTTSDTRIAQALKAPYLGTCAMINLCFARKGSSTSYKIFCHHGNGNGIMPYSPLTKLYHIMQGWEADCYLIGHQHKNPAMKPPRMYMNDNPPYKLICKKKILAGTGGFFKGYMEGTKAVGTNRPEGSYVEKELMSPVSLGGVRITITPIHKEDRDFIDHRVEI